MREREREEYHPREHEEGILNDWQWFQQQNKSVSLSSSQSPDEHLLERMELTLNHEKRTSMVHGLNNSHNNINNNMTNGKKLSFSIDSLLNGSSVSISPNFHSVSKLLASSSGPSSRESSDPRKFPPSFPRFGVDTRDTRDRVSSSMTSSPPTSTSCLQSSFYPWLLAQRQAVAAAAVFHPSFAGMLFGNTLSFSLSLSIIILSLSACEEGNDAMKISVMHLLDSRQNRMLLSWEPLSASKVDKKRKERREKERRGWSFKKSQKKNKAITMYQLCGWHDRRRWR